MKIAQETLISRISVCATSTILCLSIAIYLIVGSCTSRKSPTEPTIEIPRVMAVLTEDGTIWTVAIPDGAIHMYEPILPGAVSLAVAPNGDALYIRSQDSIIRFSFADQTRQTIYRFPSTDSGSIKIVGAGTQLFVGGFSTRIIDLANHTLRHDFSRRSYDVVEYSGSSRLFIASDTSWFLNTQTGDTNSIARSIGQYYRRGRPIVSSPDPDKVIVYYVYDICLTSIVSYRLTSNIRDTFLDVFPGSADIAVTPDSRRLFYTNAWIWSIDDGINCRGKSGPSYRVYEMDPLTFETIDTIIVGDSALPRNSGVNFDVHRVNVTGDGNYIVGMPSLRVGFVIMDAQAMAVIRKISQLGLDRPISRSIN